MKIKMSLQDFGDFLGKNKRFIFQSAADGSTPEVAQSAEAIPSVEPAPEAVGSTGTEAVQTAATAIEDTKKDAAAARAGLEVGTTTLGDLQQTQQALDAAQKRLATLSSQENTLKSGAVTNAGAKESWLGKPKKPLDQQTLPTLGGFYNAPINYENVRPTIDEQASKYESFLKNIGIEGDNLKNVKKILTNLMVDFLCTEGETKETGKAYAEALIPKFEAVFGKIKTIADNKTYGFNGDGLKAFEAFSEFLKSGLNLDGADKTGLENLATNGFIQAGVIEPTGFKEFLTISNTLPIIDSFEAYLKLISDPARISEIKSLEAQRVNLTKQAAEQRAQPLDIVTMITNGEIPFIATTITIPTDADQDAIKKTFEAAITTALGPNIDARVTAETVAYLTAEAMKLTPEPGQVFELSTEGKLERNDPEKEAQAAAEKQAKANEDTTKLTSATEEGTGVIDSIKKAVAPFLGPAIKYLTELFEKLIEMLKGWVGGETPENKLLETLSKWTPPATEEEKNKMTEGFAALNTLTPKPSQEHLDRLAGDRNESLRFIAHLNKKPTGETLAVYLGKTWNNNTLAQKTNPTSKDIADAIVGAPA